MRAEATAATPEAAKAFVRHYIDMVNYATATGDTSGLVALDDGSCRSCAAVIARIHNVYEAGGEIKSAGWRISSLTVVGKPKRPLVDAGLILSAQEVIRKRGDQPVRFEGGRLPVTFHLRLARQQWRVNDWARAA